MEIKSRSGVRDRLALFISNYKSFLILAVLMIAMACISDVFFKSRNLINVLRQVCAATILSVGFTFVLTVGDIDLSIGTMIAMIAVITAKLSKVADIPMVVVFAAALGLGAVCGLISATIINTFELPAFIVTLGMMSIYQSAAYVISNTTPVANIPEWYKAIGQGYLGPIPIPVIIMVAVIIIGFFLLNKTVFGRRVVSIGGNPEAARACGINLKKTRTIVFMINGMCAAIAAMLIVGRVASAQTSAGDGMELDAIAAAVIGGTSMKGGKGNIIGAFIGCMIVGVINNGLNLLNVDTNWQYAAKGLLILVAIILDAQSTNLTNRLLKKNTVKS